MITGIENIKTVVWRIEGFVKNLDLQGIDKLYDLLYEVRSDKGFIDVCHIAKQEIEYLSLNKNNSILQSYYEKFTYWFSELDRIKKEKINDRSINTKIRIDLNVIYEVYHITKQVLGIREFNVKYPKKNEFVERYNDNLSKYLNDRPNDVEVDFINLCSLKVNERIEELKYGLQKLKQTIDYPSPTMLKNMKNTQLRYIHECNSIITFLEAKKDNGSSKPHQIEGKQNESFTFENNFDGIPPEDVYNHFKAGLVDEKHIDLETLKKFLKQAFEGYKEGEPLKDRLKMNNTTNSLNFIIRVFHKYYSKQVSKHGKKSKYVKLLTDNFIDFDYQKTHDNFRS